MTENPYYDAGWRSQGRRYGAWKEGYNAAIDDVLSKLINYPTIDDFVKADGQTIVDIVEALKKVSE